MTSVAWDTSNLAVYFKDGAVCTSCCTPPGGWSPNDIACFLEPSGSPPLCHSDDWDQYPPFGGPGKSPGSYTLAFDGVAACPFPPYSPVQDINGVWHLAVFSCGGTLDGCFTLSTVVGGRSTAFNITLCQTSGAVYDISAADFATGLGLFQYRLNAGGQCQIAGDNAANFRQGCGTPGTIPNFGGIVSWRPGTIPAWDGATAYFVGDKVAHEGVFYQCNADHSNQEPPNPGFWDVI